jgi:cephalosporin hydroxylase
VIQSADIPGPVVEIGTLLGFSTQALCEGVMKSGHPKKVITVDNYGWNPMGVPSYRHKMLTSLNLRMVSRMTDLIIIDATADSFYQSFKEVPSFAFIDADHSYASVKKDLQFFKQIGTPVITGHDYNFPDVARAVHEVLGQNHLEVFGGTIFKYAIS